MSVAPPVLELERVGKRFRPDGPALFEQLSFTLRAGEYVAIMGESGVGKSTLLNVIAGLDRIDSGQLRIDGVDIAHLNDDAMTLLRRRTMGFVFQAFHVLPFLRVLQNIVLPLDLVGAGDETSRREHALELLARVGLRGFEHRYPRELSGGELQRVAIARALVHGPRLVLADEPTGNLDARSAAQVLALFRDQLRAGGASGILITHSLLAAETADRILRLDAGGLHEMPGRP
jgi:putative ABC transport system ATP-binding protein